MTATRTSRVVLALVFAAMTIGAHGQVAPVAALAPLPGLDAPLIRTIDPAIDAVRAQFDARAAMAHVRFVSQFWRLAGNPGYDATIDRVHRRLAEAGFAPVAAQGERRQASTWIESYPNQGKGWSYSVGTLAISRPGEPDVVLLSREEQHVALCINSFSTPPGGIVAPVIDVGDGGAEADYSGKSVRGAVVLGDAPANALWRIGVLGHGAVGVISTQMSPVVSPAPPGASVPPRDSWDVLEWGSIPYDDAHPSFGFKTTPRAAAALRREIARTGGRTRVHVTVSAAFADAPARTLVAELPGRATPAERIVITAHVQEPGANDNASGVAALVELARAMRAALASGQLPPLERTITFLWLDEIAGSRQWLKDHAADVKNVRYMFSLDMVGEDTTQTGGAFLVERWPDPAAVWERPWDPHTEWGKGDVRAEQLTGDLINDLHLAICARVGERFHWTVRTNPYEGGSDHTVFGQAGIPAVLDWHFTDRYYHTNVDTPDKTSADEMRNVASAVGASAWLLATSNESTAMSVAQLVQRAGRARIAIEDRDGQRLADLERDPRMARLRQAEIMATWRKWYGEAIRSAVRLPPVPGATFVRRLDELARTVERPQ